MPGAHFRIRPESAGGSSASDEESLLEFYLQKQLEDDIARIFDESIYSDLEVVCGKLKILTHSCILKARTHTFYQKLETILHVNINRDTFDEIYSFISDAYTECNIQHQEKEIITYLNDNLDIVKFADKTEARRDDTEVTYTDVFSTPKCVISPYVEKDVQKSISSSPSTELTKEYYALVPIESNLLEKELKEQDALLSAFQTIIRSQTDETNHTKVTHRTKPTSLSLNSSHSSKTVKHSSSCDILNRCHFKDNVPTIVAVNGSENISKQFTSQDTKTNPVIVTNNLQTIKTYACESSGEKNTESGFSPDSLLTDDPSSSSDYLSAAYTFSPGALSSSCFLQLNVGDNNIRMENIFTLSDSGCENTGMMESISSHKDVTVTDLSLSECTLHELAPDEAGNSHDFTPIPFGDKHTSNNDPNSILNSAHKDKNETCSNTVITFKETAKSKSSKEEKQRQNEEIVIMESSSLSSETGSWESVFPPKLDDKRICEKFILHEHQFSNGYNITSIKDVGASNSNCNEHYTGAGTKEDLEIKQKSYKSTSCFIDAASLVEDDVVTQNVTEEPKSTFSKTRELPVPSKPLPCSSSKIDASPNEWSESNDNDDSLEQTENKNIDNLQKDLSPTIFEMTPVSEDSLSTHNFGEVINTSAVRDEISKSTDNTEIPRAIIQPPPFTPYNSILSLMDSSLITYQSKETDSDTTTMSHPGHSGDFSLGYNRSVSLVSSGITSKEENMSQTSYFTNHYSVNRQLDDIPIVSGRCESHKDHNYEKQHKTSCAPAWVVDMTNTSPPNNTSEEKITEDGKIISKSYNSLDIISNKSRSSVDSDNSERSSQKYYLDLSSLPDPLPPEKNIEQDNACEKKNMFSMFIDLGEKSTVKEMPARLSSSLSNKKQTSVEIKNLTKNYKTVSNNTERDGEKSGHSLKNDDNFEKIESLCNDPDISISEIIEINARIPETSAVEGSVKKNVVSKQLLSSNIVSNVIEEERLEHPDVFVKLSDLDKPSQKSDISVTINEDAVLDVRMTRSIPDHTWIEQPLTSRSIEVISSFHSENALSLNRLFPNLKNEISKSMPGSLSTRTSTPIRKGSSTSIAEIENQMLNYSDASSVQSSFCRSIVGNSTTEETSQTSSLIKNCQSRLGQDLLRMFLEEIAPDIIVEVSGKRIKAHKCILSSRCPYFAGILSGGWIQSSGNVIVLPTFSYNVVHFALCHIYSGTSSIPDSVSILELATLTDMLGLEGLKEAIMFTLKAKYCHHFHKPCSLCIVGVLECFPLTSAYGLDDLYLKCLKWITKYFYKVWPTKAFATLPSELLDKCYQQRTVHLSTENLVDTVFGCGITVASLHYTRWAEIVARMCRRLINAAAHFAASRLTEILQVIATLPNDAPNVAKQALNDCLSTAIEWAPPEEACRAYGYLCAVIKQSKTQNDTKPDLITDGAQSNRAPTTNLLLAYASGWRLQCEGALVGAAPRVVRTQAFQELNLALKKRLRELGCILYNVNAIPVLTAAIQGCKNKSVPNRSPARSESKLADRSLVEQVRSTFVPYADRPPAQSASLAIANGNNQDIRKASRFDPPKIRTTKAQEERAKYNLAKTSQLNRPNRQTSATRGPSVFENTKPRYLEPKNNKEKIKKSFGTKAGAKMVSSSESSRNSSPSQVRNMTASRLKAPVAPHASAQTISQDSLETCSRPRTAEPSADSLSESQNSNKYATFTKSKHIKKGSVESVKSSKCQKFTPTAPNPRLHTNIPVYLNQTELQKRAGAKQVAAQSVPGTSHTRPATKERPHGSLMNATKSSSAKMAHKLVKDLQTRNPKEVKGQARAPRMRSATPRDDAKMKPVPPLMERSGTFLKDEPTFGDKTINRDIDQ